MKVVLVHRLLFLAVVVVALTSSCIALAGAAEVPEPAPPAAVPWGCA